MSFEIIKLKEFALNVIHRVKIFFPSIPDNLKKEAIVKILLIINHDVLSIHCLKIFKNILISFIRSSVKK